MKKLLSTLLALTMITAAAIGQCENWNDSPKKSEGEDAHSIYRGMVKNEQYEQALPYWKTAYEIAPTADGKRDFHYRDGVKIYMHLFENESDETKKAEYKEMVLKLYDQWIGCYKAGAIEIADCDGDCINVLMGNVMAEEAYDMYYFLQVPYSQNLEVAVGALELSKKGVDYTVFEPAMAMAVYEFKEGNIDAGAVREIYGAIDDATNFNLESEDEYAEYYDAARARAFSHLDGIEKEVFDCAYFLEKFKPIYEKDPTDFDVLKYVYNSLKNAGCSASEPFLLKVKTEYESLASAHNAEQRAIYEANNPGSIANKLYKEGKYAEAISKYREAINGTTDTNKKADYLFGIASIQFRKLKSYNEARASAREAASMRPNWGRPYMLIGDMYASSARSCGDSWNQRLAIVAAVEKYVYAKSIDPSVAGDASARISKYANSRPDSETMFMKGLSKGSKAKVGCWIGETVTL